MKLRSSQPLLGSADNNTHPVTKRGSPISAKWIYIDSVNYTITLDRGRISAIDYTTWCYADYYSRKVPKK